MYITYFQALLNFVGIFSDTHMLALVYCGEMCVWCVRLCGEEDCVKDKRQKGMESLSLYTDLINGPLKGKGWTIEKAMEFTEELQKML